MIPRQASNPSGHTTMRISNHPLRGPRRRAPTARQHRRVTEQLMTEYRQRTFAPPPGATEVLLVRHGESRPASADNPFPLVDGHGDPELHANGRTQAVRVGDRLKRPANCRGVRVEPASHPGNGRTAVRAPGRRAESRPGLARGLSRRVGGRLDPHQSRRKRSDLPTRASRATLGCDSRGASHTAC